MSKIIHMPGSRKMCTMAVSNQGYTLATALAKKYNCSIGAVCETGIYALDMLPLTHKITITNKVILFDGKVE